MRCAARCRARTHLARLAVVDGAFVGALGLQGELAFGLAHRVVGRPDAAAALPARSAGGELEAAQLQTKGERDTGPRIKWLLEGASRAADPRAQSAL